MLNLAAATVGMLALVCGGFIRTALIILTFANLGIFCEIVWHAAYKE